MCIISYDIQIQIKYEGDALVVTSFLLLLSAPSRTQLASSFPPAGRAATAPFPSDVGRATARSAAGMQKNRKVKLLGETDEFVSVETHHAEVGR